MKIGLYSPFLTENIGGGERYLLTVAECLLPDHRVDLILPYIPDGIKKKFNRIFNLKLDALNLVLGPFTPKHSSLERTRFTQKYDVFYYMTDGSFFIPNAKLNVVHFMIPFNRRPALFERLKLKTWPVKTANSFFTKAALEKNWKIKIDYVHWGAVNRKDFKPWLKKNIILNVGRFFSPLGDKHCKRQDLLVKTFKLMCDRGLTGWHLVLNGSIDPGKDNFDYLNKVKRLAKGYPVIFHNQGSFKTLQKDYGQAKIYWHATGYGLDETTNPQAMEHLGISTVEAMSAGAVPIVINQGGQPEIVTDSVNGLLWSSQKELIQRTKAVINHQPLMKKLSSRAMIRADDFSKAKFCHQTKTIFHL